ncbi:alcohol dehydrogenase [Sphingorhabdus lutea]|uniref:Alcohol dehydrogenase n=2 Tax=Sphingorhabdus lutea TaxID=1913578 RepID=A0A1L3JF89_9SPHN|nr:alcohol dehydrogenase [Sphingorhabdus lutea]
MRPFFKPFLAAAFMGSILLLHGCGKNDDDKTPIAKNIIVDSEYLKTGGDGTNWAMTGFSYDEQRYSPLDQINDKNVKQLGIAWFADLPDARGQEATPVIVNGRLYVTTAWSKLFAYDAKTGKELWNFDPKVPKETGAKACCDVVNRGVAYFNGKLYLGTLDGRLIAIDAATGVQLWSVATLDPLSNGTITGVPRVVKNMVIIGNGGAEFGTRGYVTAYDINTGRQLWRFYTVPNPKGEPDGEISDSILKTAINSWSKEGGNWRQSGGGGTVWDAIVYDHELDQLYIGVGNGSPWNHGIRSNGEGDNLFLSSIVALRPDTGEYIWHYQETPGETWDFTATQPIILADKKAEDGSITKVLYHAPKNGFFFTLNRKNGQLLGAEPFIKGINWASGYDMKTGRPIENPKARFYKTGEMFMSIPSALGAHNWHPMSYNPNTGMVYIPAQIVPAAYLPPANADQAASKPKGFNLGINSAGFDFPDDVNIVKAAKAAATGQLVAFDTKANKVAWTVDYPAPWNGGTMTTAGNLVFQGTSTGEFNAYSADKGTLLWSFPVQSGVLAGAATYMVDGEQYIAFLTGKGGAFPLVAGYGGGASMAVPNIARLVVMKIGGTTKFPALPAVSEHVWNPPAQEGKAADIAAGQAHFQRYCMTCHGSGAVGNAVLPDLRKSGTLADAETWKSIIIDGMLAQNGMVSFANVLSPAQADQIRQYVISRAHYAQKNEAEITKSDKAVKAKNTAK